MALTDDILSEYGRGLGLPSLGFNDAGICSLRFDRLGDLFIERLQDSLLVYLVRYHGRFETEALVAALAVGHWSNNPPFPVNAAVSGESALMFSLTLSASELNLPTVERAVSFLGRLHDSMQKGITA